MHVTRTIEGSVAVLTVKDAIVREDLNEINDVLEECSNAGVHRVVMDFRLVPHIDSAGLERLQDIVSELGKGGGDLRVTSLNAVCRDIFTATRMDSYVQVSDDLESAIRSLV
jgi:anti-anti-sigma factor